MNSDTQELGDDCADQFSLTVTSTDEVTVAQEFLAVISALLSQQFHLQTSAVTALVNHQATKREMEVREIALSVDIDNMVNECKQTSSAVDTVQERLRKSAESNVEAISTTLYNARDKLKERQESVKRVMSELEMSGRQLSMLAMNAKIEATRAGKSEAGFSVVADEVKQLAKDAIGHYKAAETIFDLSDVNDLMVSAVDKFQQSNKKNEQQIGEVFCEISDAILKMDASLTKMTGHHSIITELTHANSSAVEAAHCKVDWARKRSDSARQILDDLSFHEQSRELEKLLCRDGINHRHSYDRLADIKSRGKLRIAIEPSFIGLSFRQKNSAQLMGLDVEYATALAKYLDVSCEFVEAPWDTLTELLHVGAEPDTPPADIVLSALPPSKTYVGVAYSETYTYLNWVLARRKGNTAVRSLQDLSDKRLGIINDPGAFDLLQNLGVRWQANKHVPGGKIFLKELIAYSDQSRIHDCLAEGVVDAFGVDLPIYHWACTDSASPWREKIEICSGNIPDDPYYYCIAVKAAPSSYTLLREINGFIRQFLATPERARIENKWQGSPVSHTTSYRDEDGNLIGEPELRHIWEASRHKTLASIN